MVNVEQERICGGNNRKRLR